MKTVRIQSHDGDTTHWETCRYGECIEHECPRYDMCCGVIEDMNLEKVII